MCAGMTFRSFLFESRRRRALWVSSLACLAGVAGGSVACGVRTPLTDDIYGPGGRVEPGEDSGLETHPVVDAGVDGNGEPLANDSGGLGAPDEGIIAVADDGGFDAGLPAADLGDIVLSSGLYESGSEPTLSAAAVFYPSVTKTGCTLKPIDGCTIEVCTMLSTGDLVGAGTIDVNGGLFPLVLGETSPGVYAITSFGDAGGVKQLWVGGDTLQVTASGEVAPAFTATLGTPTQITVTTPLPTTVARSVPLTVTWLQGAGNVAIDLQETSGEAGYFLECLFPVASQAGTVPPDALATLPASAAAQLSVGTVTMTEVGASGWSMRVFARTDANDTADKEYAGNVTVE